jgi:hypothetical protein
MYVSSSIILCSKKGLYNFTDNVNNNISLTYRQPETRK